MIHSLGARKRCFSQKTSSLKSKDEDVQEKSTNEFHSGHQADVSEFAVRCDKVREQVRQIPSDPDAQQGTLRVSRCNESDKYRFVSELIWNPKGGTRASQTESAFNVCRENDSTLEVEEDISSPETSEKQAAESCEIVNECSAATPLSYEHDFQHRRGETTQMSEQTHSKSTDETAMGGGKERCEVSIPTPQHNKESLVKSNDFPKNIYSMKGHVDEIIDPDDDETLQEERTKAEEAAQEELLSRDFSLRLNDTCNIYLDADEPKFCVNTGYCTAMRNNRFQDSKHGFVPQFEYCLISTNDNSVCESVSTKVGNQSQEDPDRKIPIITVDSMDYCNLECETGLRNSDFNIACKVGNQSQEDPDRKIPIITVDSMDYCNLECKTGLRNYDFNIACKVGNQSQEDPDRKIPIITVDSMDYCNLEHETELRNSDFTQAQLINSIPASSECNIAQNRTKTSQCRQGYKFSRSISHSDVSSLAMSRNNQFSCAVDIFYESLSDPEGIDITKHGAEAMTESRRQSLEDVVPELPSRFMASADRFGNSSGFVQNLFWWRRPSDITELRSRTKHPCEEEEEENTECEVLSSDSKCRRHSDNVFCKPKKFLSFRFNQLREMWNKRDKHPGKKRPDRSPSPDSVEVIELKENKEDPEFLLRQEERNELIINTLREVVRKCTIMDPMLRPRSEDVYKKLQKLLLK